jgi:hypothetical protein
MHSYVDKKFILVKSGCYRYISLKANKSKKTKVLIESPSEGEEEEDEREYDEDEVALFIKRFNKFIEKRRPYKGDRREKPRSKRVCYNCGENGHFIN